MLLKTANLFINETGYDIKHINQFIQLDYDHFLEYFIDDEAEVYIGHEIDYIDLDKCDVVYKTKDDLCFCKVDPEERNRIQEEIGDKVEIYLKILELYKTI